MSSLSGRKVSSAVQPKPEDYDYDLDRALTSVMGLHAFVPQDAFTAENLGTERAGNAVLIRDSGVVLTISYLITEAETVWLTPAEGPAVPGRAPDRARRRRPRPTVPRGAGAAGATARDAGSVRRRAGFPGGKARSRAAARSSALARRGRPRDRGRSSRRACGRSCGVAPAALRTGRRSTPSDPASAGAPKEPIVRPASKIGTGRLPRPCGLRRRGRDGRCARRSGSGGEGLKPARRRER